MASTADIFSGMAGAVDASKLAGINATVQFDLSGDDGGTWHVQVTDGKLTSGEGAAEKADATIIMKASDYKDLTSGKLNPMTAFMTGKVKVDGDLNTVMKFQGLFS